MTPFLSERVISGDYSVFSIDHQLELLFSLQNGSFPLYVPGFVEGMPAVTLTLGQLFHPISQLSGQMPGYWDGYALEWNTFFRFISLGITHLLLFKFILRLKNNPLNAFLLSTLAIYSNQVLGNLVFGAALDSMVGHFLVCTMTGLYFLNPSKLNGTLIAFSTYLLVNSGHPQIMYYGLIGAGLFVLIIPFYIPLVQPELKIQNTMIMKNILSASLWLSLGILMSSAYIIPYYFDFVLTNAGRVGKDYAWADSYRDTFFGTISNFFLPFRSQLAFGSTSLYLMVAILPILKFFRVKIPKTIWCIWLLLLIIFLHMQGGRLPVHYLFWKYIPLASSFRVSGRISLIMPIFLMLLFLWLFNTEHIKIRIKSKVREISNVSILAFFSLIFYIFYIYLLNTITINLSDFSPYKMMNISPWVENLYFAVAFVLFIMFVFDGNLFDRGKTKGIIFCTIFCFQIIFLMYYCTPKQPNAKKPTFGEMMAQKRDKLRYQANLPGGGFYSKSILKQSEKAFLEPYMGKLYPDYILSDDEEETYTIMAAGRRPDQVIVENFVPDREKYTTNSKNEFFRGNIDLIYSSFNYIKFKVESSSDSFFGLNYPFSKNWSAKINDKDIKIYRINGIYQGVFVPEGSCKIEFRYASLSSFWGMLISCGSLLFWGVMVSSAMVRKKSSQILISCLMVMIPILLFIKWQESLYSGDDLNTKYSWTYSDGVTKNNIAYSRQTYSSFYMPEYPYLYRGGCAVDGKKDTKFSFISDIENNPYWMVDFLEPRSFNSIKIYETKHNRVPSIVQFVGSGILLDKVIDNQRPLFISFSDDQKKWRRYSIKQKGFIELEMEKPIKARYVMVSATGVCRLALDEVEIYSSE